jgi:hypothetical protein
MTISLEGIESHCSSFWSSIPGSGNDLNRHGCGTLISRADLPEMSVLAKVTSLPVVRQPTTADVEDLIRHFSQFEQKFPSFPRPHIQTGPG